MSGKVTYEYNSGQYGIIRLQRPEKRNAISAKMIEQFRVALEEAKTDNIKFLIITSSGDQVFCSGGDLNDLHGDLTSDEAFLCLYPMKEVLFELVSFPVPTICLLNGDAIGGGCEIATACDFRITKESAKFGFVQSKLGIVPGWGGGVLLYEKVHSSFAYNWLLNGEIYDATHLLTSGWLHTIVPDEEWEDIDQLIKPYKSKSLEQMKVLKSQYKNNLSVLALSAQMSEEVRQCASLWETEEHKIAVQRFLTK